MITTSQSLVGDKMRTELNFGLLEIHGEAIGVKEVTSESLEELITLVLKVLAHGLYLLILGLMMLETRLNLMLRNYHQSLLLNMKDHVKDYLLREWPST